MPLYSTGRVKWAIPFAFEDYLELVYRTGRAIHPSKRGDIPPGYPGMLDRRGTIHLPCKPAAESLRISNRRNGNVGQFGRPPSIEIQTRNEHR